MRWKFLCFSFYPLSVTVQHGEDCGSLFFIPSHQVLIHIDKMCDEPSLLQAKKSQLSQALLLKDACVTSESLWPFAGLAAVRPCLSCTGQPSTGHSTPDGASPVLTRGEGSPLSTCWQTSPEWSPGGCRPALPHSHTAGSWAACCPAGPPGPSLETCFPATQPPACTGPWGYSCPGAGLCVSLG